MPEAVIVSAARSPIGRAFKGSLKDLRPDDLTATIIQAALAKVPELDPTRHRRPDARLRPPRRRAGPQPRPHRRRADGHGPPPRLHRHPLLLLLAADHPHGAARHQGGRGRRLHLGGRRDGLPRSPRATPTASRTRTTRSSPRPRPAPPPSPSRRAPRLARPARGRPAPRRVHRDGPDRREPGPPQGRHPPGHGRVRRPLAEPRRGGHQERLLGARDHPGHDCPTARSSRRTTARAPASPWRASRASSRSSAPTAWSPPATAAR